MKYRANGSRLKITKGQRVFNVFNVLIMIALSVIMFYPMWHVFCASFSNPKALIGYRGILLAPLEPTLLSYKMMFKNSMLITGYKNTLIILTAGTALSILLTSVCAYVLSRKNVYWNKLFSRIIILTMFFGGGLVPTYLVVSKTLHMNNTLWALFVPNALSVYNMLIMRTSFAGIPQSLEESAKLDGAGEWTILFRIIIPLSKAIIAVMVLYYGVGYWNSWFDASIYLKDRELYPLQLFLREILITNDTTQMASGVGDMDKESVGETIKYSVIIFATVPILCVYPFLQKYFVQGVMIGAVKG